MRFRLPSVFSLLLVLSVELAAQRSPGVLEARRGEQLHHGYELRTRGRLFQKSTVTRSAALVAQLPVDKLSPRSRLVGVFDFDGDGQQEVFLGWRTSPEAPFVHHFQVYRIQSKGAVFLGQFSFEGGPYAGIAFYESPGRADTPKTVFEVMGGAKWGLGDESRRPYAREGIAVISGASETLGVRYRRDGLRGRVDRKRRG